MFPFALSIPVLPSASIVAAGRRTKASLFARICGNRGSRPGGGAWVDLEMPSLTKPLLLDLTHHLDERLPEPWEATRWFMESYLRSLDHEVVLRGIQGERNGRWQWMLQLRFSQCAAMTEVSARVAVHWAGQWLTRRRAEVERSVLAPDGLTLEDVAMESPVAAERFLPVGEFGHAAYMPDTPTEYGFVLDEACHINDPGAALRTLRRLEDDYAEVMEDGRCRCQLCMPEFAAEQCTLAGMLA